MGEDIDWKASVERRLQAVEAGVRNYESFQREVRAHQSESREHQGRVEIFMNERRLTEQLQEKYEAETKAAEQTRRQLEFERTRNARWRNGWIISVLSTALLGICAFLAVTQWNDHESVQEFRKDVPALTGEVGALTTEVHRLFEVLQRRHDGALHEQNYNRQPQTTDSSSLDGYEPQ